MVRRIWATAAATALTVGVFSLAVLAEPPESPHSQAAPQTSPAPPVVSVWTLRREWGDRFASKPIIEAVREAERSRPALVVIEVDSVHVPPRELLTPERQVPEATAERFWHAYVDVAPALSALLELKAVPVVVHVRTALGSAGAVPWMGHRRYMVPTARWGGLSQAWEWVAQRHMGKEPKQRSYNLRLARLLSLMVARSRDSLSADGYIVKAMVRYDYTLSVSFIGGKPLFYEDMTTGDELLTDDANPDAGRADPDETYFAYRGNDVLTLDAPLAERLGVINGSAETLDDVLRCEGFDPAAVRIDRRTDAIFDRWVAAVDEARRQIAAHWSSIQVLAGPDLVPPSDPAHLKRVKSSLTRIMELIETYGCAIDVSTIEGQPLVVNELLNILGRMQEQARQPR